MNENMRKLFFETRILSLATVCDDRAPYGTLLRFMSDGEYIYFDNVPTSVHLNNIRRDSRVFVNILNTDGADSISGYIRSRAEIISGVGADRVFELLKTVGSPDPKNNVYCRVKIGEIDKTRKVKNPERQFYFINNDLKEKKDEV